MVLKGAKRSMKRFTLSLDRDDYDGLSKLATTVRPRLSMQYLVQLAVHRFLKAAENKSFKIELRDPANDE